MLDLAKRRVIFADHRVDDAEILGVAEAVEGVFLDGQELGGAPALPDRLALQTERGVGDAERAVVPRIVWLLR